MNTNEFLNKVKLVLKGRVSKKYTIYTNELEEFTSKRSFGTRLLELVNDSRVSNIVLKSFEEKGCFGIVCDGFYTLLNSGGITEMNNIRFNVEFK